MNARISSKFKHGKHPISNGNVNLNSCAKVTFTICDAWQMFDSLRKRNWFCRLNTKSSFMSNAYSLDFFEILLYYYCMETIVWCLHVNLMLSTRRWVHMWERASNTKNRRRFIFFFHSLHIDKCGYETTNWCDTFLEIYWSHLNGTGWFNATSSRAMRHNSEWHQKHV